MSAPRSSSVVPLGDSAPRLASISCCYRCSAAVAADDGDDESFAEGVRRAGSCDHRRSAAGGGTIRGGVVGVNIGAAFAVGVIGLLPPPPHDGKRRKAVAITAGASVGASSPLVPNYLRPERRTHARARSLSRSRDQKDESDRDRRRCCSRRRRSVWMGRCSHARSLSTRNSRRSLGRSILPSYVGPSLDRSSLFRVVQWQRDKILRDCAARPE